MKQRLHWMDHAFLPGKGGVEKLLGQTLSAVESDEDSVTFTMSDGQRYRIKGDEDCCSHTMLEDIVGDVQDLVGGRFIEAELVTEAHAPDPDEMFGTHHTWSFYKLGTTKGHVVLRFLGESEGYYSEEATFYKEVPTSETWLQ